MSLNPKYIQVIWVEDSVLLNYSWQLSLLLGTHCRNQCCEDVAQAIRNYDYSRSTGDWVLLPYRMYLGTESSNTRSEMDASQLEEVAQLF